MSVGFAVAGGRSLRMGCDKALLPWGSGTLLDHTLDRLRAVCSEVCILGGSAPRHGERGLSVLLDVLPDAGPLAGICAGLEATGSRVGLFLAVDLPFVPEGLLRRLLELAEDVDAVVPITEDGPQPLCAAYGSACLAPIRRRLEAGERKMTCFWPDVRVRRVGPAQLSSFGDPAALFRNLNTPEDYEGGAPR